MRDSVSWVHHFEPYTATHACVVAAFVMLVAAMVAMRRRDDIATVPPNRRAMDYAIGYIGLAAAVFVQVVTLWPGRFDVWTSLPLHVCDICMFVAPLSLLLGWRPLRAIAYFWGLGLSSMSFIFPDLRFGPGDFQFWVFWTGHATIVGTALYDITARGYRPRFGDWWIAVKFGVFYAGTIFLVDALWHFNYGYVGQTYKNQRSPADFLGPWPWRVPLMVAMAFAAMFLLLAPWLLWRRHGGTGYQSAIRGMPRMSALFHRRSDRASEGV
ncbi:MAG TPA: TIGR02206 family membrane protein [Tepidisphaeraceae bacterium]|nr:TIGR02206 family membrane protein [Tepidisphaeraceae bacterium]